MFQVSRDLVGDEKRRKEAEEGFLAEAD